MPTIRSSPQRTRLDGGIATSGASASDFGGGAALAQAGAALADFGSSINRAQQQQEISDLNVFTTETNGRYMAQLAEAARLSPLGDNSYAEKLQEGMSRALAERSESISTAGGRQAFDRAAAAMRVDFAARVSGSVVKRAGDKAVLDHTRIVDANNNLVLQDPSQLPDILARMQTMAKDPNSIYAAAPDGAEKLLQDDTYKLYGSYVSGLINLDAGDTLDKLEKGLYDNVLTDDDKVRKVAEAEAAIRAARADAAAQQAAADRARNRASEDALNEYLKNPGAPGAADAARKNPLLTPQHKMAIATHLEAYNAKGATAGQQDEMRRISGNLRGTSFDEIRRNPKLNQAQRDTMEAVKSRDEGQTEKARQEGIVNAIRRNWDGNSSQDLADRTDIPLSLSKALMSMKKAREDAKASTSAEENARIDRVMKDAVPGLSGMSDKDIEALPLPFKMHKVLKDMRNGINDRTARAEATAADKASLKAFNAYNARLADDPQSVTQAEVLSDKTLTKEDQTTILARIKAFGPKPPTTAESSALVANDLHKRIYLPADDPRRLQDKVPIMSAFGQMTPTDYNRMMKAYDEFQTPDGRTLGEERKKFFDPIEKGLNQSILNFSQDVAGALAVRQVNVIIDRIVASYRKDGKDPYDLFTPGTKPYEELTKIIKAVAPTIQERTALQYSTSKRNAGGSGLEPTGTVAKRTELIRGLPDPGRVRLTPDVVTPEPGAPAAPRPPPKETPAEILEGHPGAKFLR